MADAASGRTRWLEEQGIGFNVDVASATSCSLKAAIS